MEERYEYIRQAEHCYLRLEAEMENSFETTILLQNPLPELLTCRQQRMNGKTYLLYDITSCKVVGDWWLGKELRQEEIQVFVREIIHVLRECDRHLLDREKVILRPDRIFCNMDAGQYYFLYDPCLNPQEGENLLCLASYLVEKADYKQQAAVDLAYRIYEGVTETNFTLRTLEQCLEYSDTCQETASEEKEEKPQTAEPMEVEAEFWETEPEKNSKGKHWVQKGALVISGLTLLLGGLVWYAYELNRQEMLALAGIMMLAVVTAGCSLFSWFYKEKRKEEQEMLAGDILLPESSNRKADTESEKTVYLTGGALLAQRGLQGMGQEWQRWISLGQLPLVVGKKESLADYVLEDTSISRIHARFMNEEERVFIMDLHSTNGTFVNGERLEPDHKVEIHVGDRIGLGKLNFTYC